MYLIFDTETTGLPKNFKAPITDTDNWPRCIQIAWQLHDELGNLIEHQDYLVKPDGFTIPYQSEKIHGISTELATEEGLPLAEVLEKFKEVLGKTKFVVGQNVTFDNNVMGCELYRQGVETSLMEMPVLDTCTEKTAKLCKIPGGRGGRFKLPTLTELHQHLFGKAFSEAHNATADVEATTRCFLELLRLRVFTADELKVEEDYFTAFDLANPDTIEVIGLKHINLKKASKKYVSTADSGISDTEAEKNLEELTNVRFSHLHNHSQFSILQATSEVKGLIAKAAEMGMPAVGLTDNGNMMAAFHFIEAGIAHNKEFNEKIKALKARMAVKGADLTNVADWEQEVEQLEKKIVKPVLGVDFYVCKDHLDKSFKDNGFSVPLLAKNKSGYHNLAKMSSEAHVNGFYYVPRIDRDVILAHKDNLIALTGGLLGEIPAKILNEGEEKAEEAFKWWHEQFGEDFYVELCRHGLEEEQLVNETLLRFAKKYGVKYIAANNSFYLDQDDSEAHDILLCVKEGELKSTPIGRGRGFRFGFPNNEFYFKSQEVMKDLFKDLPDSIATTNEIVDKIELYGLAREVLLPEFDIPKEFQDPKDKENPQLKNGENAYLRHITYEGAKKRYGEISPEMEERIDFELDTIRNTGYPGYFLIVEDFIREARKMNVSVGPGRGSAAGSVVAYCTWITNIDPIKYDLLFERFLNPERVSMPDIDIDFDDEGRGRVMQYVIDKYGSSQVAQIITYGTMAAKSSIRDCGRVLDLSLSDTDRIAKLVPDTKLNKLLGWDEETINEKLNSNQVSLAKQLIDIFGQQSLEGKVLRSAKSLEGSIRNTGIHACGVIITPSDIRDFVPVSTAKDSEMWCTQFDNSVAEDAGLLKMDFLGLKTLTLIKDTLAILKAREGLEIDIENIPLDDELTYKLFQRGETVGVFQYESAGMQKHLRALKPTVFPDLIAMNALYRPGPMEYIPSFIKRKHGDEEIEYDLDACEEYLDETYGITVYQEQVMLLSQKLAGFTKGEADSLRKAMGKKKKDLIDKMKSTFIAGGKERGHDKKALEKIWTDWEAFASYAFNKSHSTCYAWIAYQTAYLKAHHPAEYMAAVLSNNMNDIKSITFFMEECKRMGLQVLGPDVNESYHKFAVNDEGNVRFGMGAIKGVGEGAVKAIIEERKENGKFKTVGGFMTRVDQKSANKGTIGGLVLGGGFDSFEISRAKYFGQDDRGVTYLDQLIKYGNACKQQVNAPPDLFGDTIVVEFQEPIPPEIEDWGTLDQLAKEKEVVGVYISGHPLDEFKLEMKYFCNSTIAHVNSLDKPVSGEISIAGMVTDAQHRISKSGNPFGKLIIEDYTDSREIMFFSKDYVNFKSYLDTGWLLHLKGNFQPKWKNSEPQFNVNSIEILNDLRDKLAKSVTLKLQLSMLTENTLDRIEKLAEEHAGKCRVILHVVDEAENLSVTMPSRKMAISPTNDFFDTLAEENIEFKLN